MARLRYTGGEGGREDDGGAMPRGGGPRSQRRGAQKSRSSTVTSSARLSAVPSNSGPVEVPSNIRLLAVPTNSTPVAVPSNSIPVAMPSNSTPVVVSGSSRPTPIVVDDDDEEDDVHIQSASSYAEAVSASSSNGALRRRARRDVNHASPIRVDPSLGQTTYVGDSGSVVTINLVSRAEVTSFSGSGSVVVDLTSPTPSFDPDCILVNQFVQKKRKPQELQPVERAPEPKELTLMCSICLGSMKEDTSTTCGHLFCKGCIVKSLKVQHKCPTCRKPLFPEQIHPVYIRSSIRDP